MASNVEEGLVQTIAETLKSRETIIRYLLAVAAGYPLAYLYRSSIIGKPATVQHIYFTVCGLFISIFTFGYGALHTVFNTILVYLLLRIVPGTKLSVFLAFLINNVYLTLGYYYVNNYVDITWTIPQCILTLKLTSLTMDVYDGKKKKEKLSEEQKETALEEVPSLLQMLGQAFFFGGYLAGPQFSMKRYQDFTNGTLFKEEGREPPPSIAPGIRRLIVGVVYIGIHHIGGMIIPDEYLFQKGFADLNIVMKCVVVMAWGRFALNKYVGIWLVTEGPCIITGFSYNGQDVNGNILWNATSNVRVRKLEKTTLLADAIKSFNIETNKWMARYIFKRLRFLGNKLISQAVTLFYLAFWHGLCSGYYMNFLLEFFIMNFENQARVVLGKIPFCQKMNAYKPVQPLLWILRKSYQTFFLSYALLSFILLKYEDFMYVYSLFYFIPHIIVFLPFALVAFKAVLPRKKFTQNGDIHLKNSNAADTTKRKEE